jgi:N-acyl-D-aspartate/D-glutamate deacylase
MSYDIVIKIRAIVDGAGRAGYRADLAVIQIKNVENCEGKTMTQLKA